MLERPRAPLLFKVIGHISIQRSSCLCVRRGELADSGLFRCSCATRNHLRLVCPWHSLGSVAVIEIIRGPSCHLICVGPGFPWAVILAYLHGHRQP
jgi:hypothetical protein